MTSILTISPARPIMAHDLSPGTSAGIKPTGINPGTGRKKTRLKPGTGEPATETGGEWGGRVEEKL